MADEITTPQLGALVSMMACRNGIEAPLGMAQDGLRGARGQSDSLRPQKAVHGLPIGSGSKRTVAISRLLPLLSPRGDKNLAAASHVLSNDEERGGRQ
jgi:hypothetical protein